ncbi:ATP-binding protein [Amycolatopsis kentuckyensis]|uniref:ATP-binding protein n=1 Tax=Amycolatopsis kentuckyensis TaxID=218823 RepID=UPI0035647336
MDQETLTTVVGRVAGTEDSTPLQFHVAIDPEAYLQLDDVVVTRRQLPGLGEVTSYGVVTQVSARHEGASFGSDVFLISDGVLPAQVQEIAEIATTRVEPECYVPPKPGSQVSRAVGEDRAQALYFDNMTRQVAVGLGRDGEPVYLNMDFLDGTRGAHVSISGVSGVATKTSFALFLLHSIFRGGALPNAHNAKALVFSVKGEDLLFLDTPNRALDEKLRDEYLKLGLPAEPFASVGFYAPPTPSDTTGKPYVTGRTSGVGAFWWTIAEFCANDLLPYVFADAEDERNQYTMVIHQVANRLRLDSTPAGKDGAATVDGVLCRTYAELVDVVCERVTDEETRASWAGAVTGAGTVNAFIRRLRSSQRALSGLIRGDLTDHAARKLSTENQQVTVVDIHNLVERAQRFVVGVTLATETARKEAAGPGGLLFTMLDELNKYAPREGSSPIKEVLLDIAERGRSLGVILIGAQQTASEVERRIVSNSSVRIVGRLDAAEASRPEYGFLPASQRVRATLATPGTMFVSQPEIPVPIAVGFPFPAWATRLSEAGKIPETTTGLSTSKKSDPFAGLPTRGSDPFGDDPPPF